MGTQNKEPQECSRQIVEYKDPGRYVPIIFLLFSWGSLFGVPRKDPLGFRFQGLGFRVSWPRNFNTGG